MKYTLLSLSVLLLTCFSSFAQEDKSPCKKELMRGCIQEAGGSMPTSSQRDCIKSCKESHKQEKMHGECLVQCNVLSEPQKEKFKECMKSKKDQC
jgi:hypothetical protein